VSSAYEGEINRKDSETRGRISFLPNIVESIDETVNYTKYHNRNGDKSNDNSENNDCAKGTGISARRFGARASGVDPTANVARQSKWAATVADQVG
jgi:hypothetical protein